MVFGDKSTGGEWQDVEGMWKWWMRNINVQSIIQSHIESTLRFNEADIYSHEYEKGGVAMTSHVTCALLAALRLHPQSACLMLAVHLKTAFRFCPVFLQPVPVLSSWRRVASFSQLALRGGVANHTSHPPFVVISLWRF